MTGKLVFFDLETGGLDSERHAITQLAAIAVDAASLSELETFERKLRFKPEAAEQEALDLGSYDPKVWEREAVAPPDALRAFSAFLSDHATKRLISARTGKPYHVAQLAGHNAAIHPTRHGVCSMKEELFSNPASDPLAGLDIRSRYTAGGRVVTRQMVGGVAEAIRQAGEGGIRASEIGEKMTRLGWERVEECDRRIGRVLQILRQRGAIRQSTYPRWVWKRG